MSRRTIKVKRTRRSRRRVSRRRIKRGKIPLGKLGEKSKKSRKVGGKSKKSRKVGGGNWTDDDRATGSQSGVMRTQSGEHWDADAQQQRAAENEQQTDAQEGRIHSDAGDRAPLQRARQANQPDFCCLQ